MEPYWVRFDSARLAHRILQLMSSGKRTLALKTNKAYFAVTQSARSLGFVQLKPQRTCLLVEFLIRKTAAVQQRIDALHAKSEYVCNSRKRYRVWLKPEHLDRQPRYVAALLRAAEQAERIPQR